MLTFAPLTLFIIWPPVKGVATSRSTAVGNIGLPMQTPPWMNNVAFQPIGFDEFEQGASKPIIAHADIGTGVSLNVALLGIWLRMHEPRSSAPLHAAQTALPTQTDGADWSLQLSRSVSVMHVWVPTMHTPARFCE